MSLDTMTKIATYRVPSTQAVVEFTNIPQGYTDLLLKISARTNRGTEEDGLYMALNGETSTNWINIESSGSTLLSRSTASYGNNWISRINGNTSTSNLFGVCDVYISNYTVGFGKVVSTFGVSENNSTTLAYQNIVGTQWNFTKPVTSFSFAANASFMTNTTFTIYGIRAQRTPINNRKSYVTGGTLSSDSNYYYRKFTSSGTLDISGNTLSADILVIAGGGSGGASNSSGFYGGGGGAGGLLGFTNVKLNGTIPVVIGAGGAYPGSNLRGLRGSNSSLGSTVALGGGGGGGGSDSSALITAEKDGGSGGSGGGGQSAVNTGSGLGGGTGGSGTSGQGNNGGNGGGVFQVEPQAGGGGGGAGGAGGNASGAGTGGAGGIGSSAYSSWGLATSSGQLSSGVYYFAGGGGGASNGTGGAAGLGGGGAGGGSNGANGTANTGGGAGNGMVGGSGIVIIRYTKEQVL